MSVVADMCVRTGVGGRPPTEREARRNKITSALEYITLDVRVICKYILTQVEIDQLNVKVEELDTSDASPKKPHYFEQMPASKLQEYPVASDKETQDLLAKSNDTLKSIASEESAKSDYEIAEAFACRLHHEMSGFKREGINKHSGKPLITLTNWRYLEKLLPSVMMTDFYRIVFRSEGTQSSPVGVWYEYDHAKVPHVMMSMKHEFNWDENLLTVELLLITSCMRSRFAATTIRHRHTVIPVMIFSFGAKHGRILQAFYDGKNLVIRKSKLIDLTDLSSRPFDVFVRFAASKPVGNTRTSLIFQNIQANSIYTGVNNSLLNSWRNAEKAEENGA